MPIITENWQIQNGVGGLPRWVVTGYATYDAATIGTLELNAARFKFTPLPNKREIQALALDGVSVSTQSIRPFPYREISKVVKISPVHWSPAAPVQQIGEYAGKAIIQYRVEFQQLQWNHY